MLIVGFLLITFTTLGATMSTRRWKEDGKVEAYEEICQKKPPKTFEQQIKIFRDRNLIIEDEEEAIDFLKRVSYYRLTGYTLTLKENDKFFDGVTFNDIRYLYEFDKKFRSLLLEMLEDIEVSFY